jgi:Tol biopolymer transport system component
MQIYVRQVSGGRPVALTSDSADNFRWPRWSPDGSRIAYQSNDGIYIVPSLGGAPQRVMRVDTRTLRYGIAMGTPIAGLDWSPDGTRIVWSGGMNGDDLVVKTLSTGDTVAFPTPPGGALAPAWSPDGRAVAVSIGNPAFIFGSGYFGNVGESSVWIVPLDGSPATRVTSDSAMNVSPQWSPDGRVLFWVSDRGGSRDVYQQSINARGAPVGTPRRLTTGTDAQGLSVSRGSGRLAYSRLTTWSSIWSMPIPPRGPVSIRGATRISPGNETIEDVDVSADGRWLVFDSDRSGNPELYVMPAAGGEARQITNDAAGDFSPDWSPDGRRIVFHSLRTGNRDVFTVDADGTGLKQWTFGVEQELDPDWAADGETILFEKRGVTRAGFATLRLAEGAEQGLIPAPHADFAHWSPVGRAVVYHSVDGIRGRGSDAGAETLIVSNAADSAEAFYAAWSPDGGKLYYLTRSARGWTVRVVPATGGVGSVLVTFDDPTRQQTRYGFCTDGKLFYFTIGSPESDIYVADLSRP